MPRILLALVLVFAILVGMLAYTATQATIPPYGITGTISNTVTTTSTTSSETTPSRTFSSIVFNETTTRSVQPDKRAPGNILREPGLYLEFKLYDYNASSSRIIEETELLSDPSIVFSLEVTAIAPPTRRENLIVVHNASYKGSNIVFIPLSKLYDIAREWVEVYKSRRGDPEKTYSGLILRAFILNVRTRETLYELYGSIAYKPIDIVKGKSLRYTVYLAKGSPGAIGVDVSYINVSSVSVEKLAKEVNSNNIVDPDYAYTYRELVVEVKPEDLTSVLPSSYFKSINGKLYVKTPVLIAWNKYDYSGSVGVSINIGKRNAKVGVYPTFSSGKILSSLLNGTLPNVVLWKGPGYTWGSENYYYGMSNILAPNMQWWAWIWSIPVSRIYKVYYCFREPDGWHCGYVKDDVESIELDVLTYGSTIQGGYDYGLPHEALMNNFYNGTNLTLLSVPGTYLDDGKLVPGEYIALEQIFQYYDTCSSNYEVGIPVGTYAATGICSVLSASLGPIGPAACFAAQSFLSAFQLSLSYESPSIYIAGGVVNHGDHPGIPGDYNVPGYVYVRVSRYKYMEPGTYCYYDVPAGIYFEFH